VVVLKNEVLSKISCKNKCTFQIYTMYNNNNVIGADCRVKYNMKIKYNSRAPPTVYFVVNWRTLDEQQSLCRG